MPETTVVGRLETVFQLMLVIRCVRCYRDLLRNGTVSTGVELIVHKSNSQLLTVSASCHLLAVLRCEDQFPGSIFSCMHWTATSAVVESTHISCLLTVHQYGVGARFLSVRWQQWRRWTWPVYRKDYKKLCQRGIFSCSVGLNCADVVLYQCHQFPPKHGTAIQYSSKAILYSKALQVIP